MSVIVRPATNFDARAMADLLNEIIRIGGTTALTQDVTGDDIKEWMADNAERAAWHVATDEAENCLGFQWIKPKASLPPEACDIATFVKVGRTGLGTGSKLFDATKSAALALGYDWINANIRSDNDSGLTYYQSRGFRTYDHDSDVTLSGGLTVDKTLKRYDLKD